MTIQHFINEDAGFSPGLFLILTITLHISVYVAESATRG